MAKRSDVKYISLCDPLIQECVKLYHEHKQLTPAFLSRKLGVTPSKAKFLIETLNLFDLVPKI